MPGAQGIEMLRGWWLAGAKLADHIVQAVKEAQGGGALGQVVALKVGQGIG